MHELRLAARSLFATPIVSLVAVLSLALGIGANTAIFSLIDSLVLRQLPVAHPEQLVVVSTARAAAIGSTGAWSHPVWEEIRRRPQLFADVAAWSNQRFNLAQRGETEFVDGTYVSGSFFRLLGVPALIGRTLTEADDRRGGGPDGPVAMLGHGFWQRRFGGAADVVGRTLMIERVPFVIVGVTPPSFFGTSPGQAFDVLVPVGSEPLIRGTSTRFDQPAQYWLTIMGRLRPGDTIAGVTSALKTAEREIRATTMPPNFANEVRDMYLAGRQGFLLVPAATGTSGLRARYERPLVTILAVTALVLLIACANIANLLLARAAARRHELAVRRALGASRWRLVRQLLIESAILAGAGAVAGEAFASVSTRALIQQLSTRTNAVFLDVSPNLTILIFTATVTTAAVLLFGIVPAWRASGVGPMDALKEGGRGAVGASLSAANALVVAQVALSIVLVVTAGLFLRTFTALESRPLGFDAERLLVANLDAQRLPGNAVARDEWFTRIRDAVANVPGVDAAALSMVAPIQGGGITNWIEVSGGRQVPPTLVGGMGNAYGNLISSGWFQALGIPVLAGRDFIDADRRGGSQVAIVNQALVRAFLGGVNPLGRTLKHAGGNQFTIVGVVADSTYGSLREPATPTFYEPIQQALADVSSFALMNLNLTIRTAGPPAAAAKTVAAAIERVNPDVAVTLWTVSDQVNAALVQERMTAILGAFFGGLALVLAGLGLYGVTSYAVARRRGEIGIRMALGASPSGIRRLVLSRVVVLVGTGVVIGTMVSLWATRFIASLLYGLAPRDAAAVVSAILALLTIGAVAGAAPAQRASRIDPAEILRDI